MLKHGKTVKFADLQTGTTFVFAGDWPLERFYTKLNADRAQQDSITILMRSWWEVDLIEEKGAIA